MTNMMYACGRSDKMLILSEIVVTACLSRRKSTRLTAVVGGLTMALAILFASFAKELHQVMIR